MPHVGLASHSMGREVELAKKNCQNTWEILKLMTDIQHAQELAG
jgi:hypothetical protein